MRRKIESCSRKFIRLEPSAIKFQSFQTVISLVLVKIHILSFFCSFVGKDSDLNKFENLKDLDHTGNTELKSFRIRHDSLFFAYLHTLLERTGYQKNFWF